MNPVAFALKKLVSHGKMTYTVVNFTCLTVSSRICGQCWYIIHITVWMHIVSVL